MGDEQLAVQGGLKVVHDGALADAGLAAEEDGAGALALAEALDAGQQQQHLLLPAKEVFRRVLAAGLGGAAAAQLAASAMISSVRSSGSTSSSLARALRSF